MTRYCRKVVPLALHRFSVSLRLKLFENQTCLTSRALRKCVFPFELVNVTMSIKLHITNNYNLLDVFWSCATASSNYVDQAIPGKWLQQGTEHFHHNVMTVLLFYHITQLWNHNTGMNYSRHTMVLQISIIEEAGEGSEFWSGSP